MSVPDAQRNTYSIAYNVVYCSFLYPGKEAFLRILLEFTIKTNRMSTVKRANLYFSIFAVYAFNEYSLFSIALVLVF